MVSHLFRTRAPIILSCGSIYLNARSILSQCGIHACKMKEIIHLHITVGLFIIIIFYFISTSFMVNWEKMATQLIMHICHQFRKTCMIVGCLCQNAGLVCTPTMLAICRYASYSSRAHFMWKYILRIVDIFLKWDHSRGRRYREFIEPRHGGVSTTTLLLSFSEWLRLYGSGFFMILIYILCAMGVGEAASHHILFSGGCCADVECQCPVFLASITIIVCFHHNVYDYCRLSILNYRFRLFELVNFDLAVSHLQGCPAITPYFKVLD